MKRILITGKDSYIGHSFIKYCEENHVDFVIDELDLREVKWKKYDFSSYDSIFHVAGIAHIKETKQNEHLYYEVNRDLAIEVAKKAKLDGVKHFIFMSTMSVYGMVEGYIDENTQTNPKNAYGRSKLHAEKSIKKLSNDDFFISILRPPMIYGPNSKGNYTLLSNFAKKTKVFPSINNKRSMLFIDNLSEFLIGLITHRASGLFYPQNQEYVNTSHLVKTISEMSNNKVFFTSIFNPLINILNLSIFRKIFGNLVYDQEMTKTNFYVKNYSFEESIVVTEHNSTKKHGE